MALGEVTFGTQRYSGEFESGTFLGTNPIDWIESLFNTLKDEVAPRMNNFSVSISRGPGKSVGPIAPRLKRNEDTYFQTCNAIAQSSEVDCDNDWDTEDGLHPVQEYTTSLDGEESGVFNSATAPRMPSNIYNHTNWDNLRTENTVNDEQYNLGYDFYSFRCDLIITFNFNGKELNFRLKYPLTTTGFQYDGIPVTSGGDDTEPWSYYGNRFFFSSARASCLFYYPFFFPSNHLGSVLEFSDIFKKYEKYDNVDWVHYAFPRMTSGHDGDKTYNIREDLCNYFLKPVRFKEVVRIQCSKNDAGTQNKLITPYDTNVRFHTYSGNTFHPYYNIPSYIPAENRTPLSMSYQNTQNLVYQGDWYRIDYERDTITPLNLFNSMVSSSNNHNIIKYIQSYDNKTVFLSLTVRQNMFFNIIFFELENGSVGCLYNNQLFTYDLYTTHSTHYYVHLSDKIDSIPKVQVDSWLLRNFEVSDSPRATYGLSLYRITNIGDNEPNTRIIGKLDGKRTIFYVFKHYLNQEVSIVNPSSSLSGLYENVRGFYTKTSDLEKVAGKTYYNIEDKYEWLAMPIEQLLD